MPCFLRDNYLHSKYHSLVLHRVPPFRVSAGVNIGRLNDFSIHAIRKVRQSHRILQLGGMAATPS